MQKISCPTLLLVGQDSLHVVETAEEMAEKIQPKYLSMQIFEGTGAPVYKDKPQEAYETVKQFLKQF